MAQLQSGIAKAASASLLEHHAVAVANEIGLARVTVAIQPHAVTCVL